MTMQIEHREQARALIREVRRLARVYAGKRLVVTISMPPAMPQEEALTTLRHGVGDHGVRLVADGASSRLRILRYTSDP